MTKEQVTKNIKPLYNTILVRLIMETGELIKGTGIMKTDTSLKIEPYVEIIAVGPVMVPGDPSAAKEPVMKPGDYALVKGRAQLNIFRLGTEDYSFISEYDLDAVITQEVADEISSTQLAQRFDKNPNLNIVN